MSFCVCACTWNFCLRHAYVDTESWGKRYFLFQVSVTQLESHFRRFLQAPKFSHSVISVSDLVNHLMMLTNPNLFLLCCSFKHQMCSLSAYSVRYFCIQKAPDQSHVASSLLSWFCYFPLSNSAKVIVGYTAMAVFCKIKEFF